MHLLDFLFRRRPGKHISHINKSILTTADVDESSLERRQNILDRPFIDMINDVHVIVAFHREITKTPLLEDSHARFLGHDVANDRFHRVTPPCK